MSHQARYLVWLVLQLALLGAWALAFLAGSPVWALVPLGLFAVRKAPAY